MTLPSNPSTRLRLAILFAVPVVFSILFFIVNTAAERNDVRLIQLQSLSSAVGKLRSLANDAEVGEHGFLLTGDEDYLTTLESANARMSTYIKRTDGWGATAPETQQRIRDLINLVTNRVQDANRAIEAQRAEGFPAAMDIAKSGHSRRIMEQIRTAVEGLQSDLSSEVSHDLDKERYLTRCAFLFFLFGTLVMLFVLVWLYNSVISYLQGRDLAHAQLKSLNAELEGRIEERTKELQEFNEELQQFAYVASHDLQEPLRTITSFTQLLEARYKGRFDQDADEFIGYIVNSSRRMTDLINGLLALVRLRKSGQGVAQVDFGELVENARVSLQALIRETHAQVESNPLPSLIVDQIQFSQVFQNLISNAIKYRRDEAPHIVVEANRVASHWTISVRDNGRGFDQKFAERIFGLFQRLQNREVDGTGMGLSIARKIVERHGGRIWAESVEGVGSIFSFSLPVSLEGRPAERESLSEVKAETV